MIKQKKHRACVDCMHAYMDSQTMKCSLQYISSDCEVCGSRRTKWRRRPDHYAPLHYVDTPSYSRGTLLASIAVFLFGIAILIGVHLLTYKVATDVPTKNNALPVASSTNFEVSIPLDEEMITLPQKSASNEVIFEAVLSSPSSGVK